MSNKRPLIGVTPWYDYDKQLTFIKKGYCEGVNKAGGLGVLLPMCTQPELMENMVQSCDGFLISGGPDVDPKYFNEMNLPFNQDISPYRDTLEIFITRRAIELNKPLFGICRGIQIMNVAMGGSLYQDIHSQINDRKLIKHSQAAPRWYPTHKINVKKDSILSKLLKATSIEVNSFHHQAIKDTAPGFEISSLSEDGIIESIEYKNHKFALGVQWHPELMWEANSVFLSLFEGLVQSCK
ncbi:MAG TPA: gamma-glutamyl-gamma-aminobutyrate hydrolase family protein [Pseudobacteroides sp.]|uniref:gamma-glutamyl-gamma-aminobutyrate hydrolase family protein n=1 Tax=Pseudobacteroides sp. TaxID=1968840 RepID=UPI002F93F09C